MPPLSTHTLTSSTFTTSSTFNLQYEMSPFTLSLMASSLSLFRKFYPQKHVTWDPESL